MRCGELGANSVFSCAIGHTTEAFTIPMIIYVDYIMALVQWRAGRQLEN